MHSHVLSAGTRFPGGSDLRFLSPGDKARQTFILRGPYMGVLNQNWRCGEKTGRPLQADGSCRSKALPVPRPLSGRPLMVARTQSCPYLDIFFFSHSDAASTEVVPKPSAKRPFGIRSSLSSPLLALPPCATCDSHFQPPVSSCFRFSGSPFPESHTQFFSQLLRSAMPANHRGQSPKHLPTARHRAGCFPCIYYYCY